MNADEPQPAAPHPPPEAGPTRHAGADPPVVVQASLPAPPADPDHPGDWIGPYKILQLLGHGGLGTVWLAERRDAIVKAYLAEVRAQPPEAR